MLVKHISTNLITFYDLDQTIIVNSLGKLNNFDLPIKLTMIVMIT